MEVIETYIYRFPDSVSAKERFDNGADLVSWHCAHNMDCVKCRLRSHVKDITECPHFTIDQSEYAIEGELSQEDVLGLMSCYGGEGWYIRTIGEYEVVVEISSPEGINS